MQSSSKLSITHAARSSTDVSFAASLIALRPRLQRYARSLAQNADVADDLVQETLLRAWKAQAQFAPETSLSAWTFTILRNLFLTARRRDRFHGAYDEVASEAIIAVGSNQDAIVDLAKVETAMAMLPEGQRQALQLVAIAGLTTDEAADRIGAPAGTVKSRVARARMALKALMAAQPPRPAPPLETVSRVETLRRPRTRTKNKKMTTRHLMIG